MNKTLRKVLSVVLALAMVVTSITVSNTTAKADVAELEVTATINAQGTIDANWTNPEGTASLKYYINEESEGNYARNGAAGWTWSVANPTEIRTYVDGVSESHDGSVKVANGGDFTIIVVVYDEAGEVIARGTSNVLTIAAYVNTDMGLFVERYDEGNMAAFLKWKTVTGAVNYKAFDAEGNEVGSTAGDWTQVTLASKNVEYTYTVKAYDAAGAEIPVTNNTATAIIEGEEESTTESEEPTTVPPVEGEAPDTSGVDVSEWVEIPVKGTNAGSVEGKYYINKAGYDAYVNTAIWGVFAPASSTSYHSGTCNLTGNAISFAIKDNSSMSVVWVDGVGYADGSDKFHPRGDSCEIALELFSEPGVHYVAVVGNATSTFAIKYEAPKAPDTSAVDVSEWEAIPVKGADAANVTNTYSMNKAGYDAYVNTAIWGVFAPASETSYHNGTCNLTGNAISFANKNDGDMKEVWVDGVRYVAGSDKLHVRGDSCEMALELFDEPGIHYVAVVGTNTTTFAIKTEAPKAEVDPDQTLTEVTDWVMVGANASADDNNYFVSEAFRNEYINYIDLFGLYTDHATSPYHPSGCTVTDAVYVSSYPKLAGTIKSVWVDGVKYTTGTEVCYIDGDQIHLSQSLFAERKTYAITVRTATADYTYALKVEETVKYNVTVDGGEATKVVAGGAYTLPTEATYGYFDGTNMYKAGATVTVESDMAFTSVNTLSVTVASGAGIKLDGNGTSGIRFQARVTSNNMDAVASDAIAEGMLITANDLYEELGNSALNLYSTYTVKNIVNNGWYNGTVGTYCASIVDIIESNYIRDFIARAYTTITYVDGSTITVYSGMSQVRNIAQVADLLIANGDLGQYTTEQQAIINTFAAAN